jgi:hypothetical protein
MSIQNEVDEAADRDARLVAGNILSGKNGCGTLENAVAAGDAEYFIAAAMPVFATRHSELAQARSDALEQAQKATAMARALEFVAQNIGRVVTIGEPAIIAEISKALGRKI